VQELTARYVVRQSTEDGPGQRGWRVADSEITEQVLVNATQDRPGEDGPSDAEDFEIPEEL
jgi:hypothetical protein